MFSLLSLVRHFGPSARGGTMHIVLTASLSCAAYAVALSIAERAYAVEKIRTWTDDTGRHKRDAIFMRRDGDTVFLQLKDGREIPIKYDRLSKPDRDFVDAAGSNKQPERSSFRELLARQTPRQLPPTGMSVAEQEEAALLGTRVEKALADGVDQVFALFDADQFAKQTMEGIELPPADATALTTQTYDNLKQFLSQIIISNKQRGFKPPKFLRGRRAGTSKRLLFRTMHESTGMVAYYEFIYEPSASNPTPLTDIWLFNTGETASNALKRGYIMLAAAINQSFVSKLVGGEAEFAKHQGEIQRVVELHKQGKVTEAIAALKTLPDSVRKDKAWLYARILWADQSQNQQEFAAAVEEYERVFPRDPSLAFVRLGSVYLGNDKMLFMDTVDKVDAAVGGDSRLACLRGLWLAARKENAEAKTHYLQAIAMNPTSLDGVALLLMHDLNDGAYAEVAEILKYGEEECGMDADNFVSAMGSDFEGFLASVEGKKWKASRRVSSQ